MSDDEHSNLGERLLAGVLSLWRAVQGHDQDIGQLKARMNKLESELHGLKTSRGMQRAKNARLEGQLREAEGKLGEIRATLH